MKPVEFAGRRIGPGEPCFIIAEAGVNHNGRLELARQLVDRAVAAGADAVKFQTFKAERLASPDAPKADYQIQTTSSAESQFDMLRRLELSPEDHADLLEHCRRLGILFMSTPFDEESADFLASLEVAVFKIPSGELTNLPYLAHLARKGRPMIISTGMAYLGEVETAVRTIEAAGDPGGILLHCVSNYPAAPADVNLRAMATLERAFGWPVGYSDHTPGLEIAFGAVALGACVIEKHFTLDRTLPGPDHPASLEPAELTELIRGIRRVEAALGTGRKEPAASEANTTAVARRSLVAARDIAPGTVLTAELIAVRRPGTGLPPSLRDYLIGRAARVAIPAGTLFSPELLA